MALDDYGILELIMMLGTKLHVYTKDPKLSKHGSRDKTGSRDTI